VRALRELAHEVFIVARTAIGAPQLIEGAPPGHAAHERRKPQQVDWCRLLAQAHEELEDDILRDVLCRFGTDDLRRATTSDGGDLEKETGFCFGVQRGGDQHGVLRLKSD
jgi:hypothetical protein